MSALNPQLWKVCVWGWGILGRSPGVRSPWLRLWGWFTLWLWVLFINYLLKSLFWSKVTILVTTGHQYHICQPLYFLPAQTMVCCHNCFCLGKTRTQNFWKTCFYEISNPNLWVVEEHSLWCMYKHHQAASHLELKELLILNPFPAIRARTVGALHDQQCRVLARNCLCQQGTAV